MAKKPIWPTTFRATAGDRAIIKALQEQDVGDSSATSLLREGLKALARERGIKVKEPKKLNQ